MRRQLNNSVAQDDLGQACERQTVHTEPYYCALKRNFITDLGTMKCSNSLFNISIFVCSSLGTKGKPEVYNVTRIKDEVRRQNY